jgi:hypothetical protein
MRKCTITVYDYSNARHGADARHYDKNNPPEVKKFDVEAFCVGGNEGVKAYFYQGDLLYEADGDDGHWWLTGVIHCDWLREIIDALKAVEKKRKNTGAAKRREVESRRIIW